MTQTNERDFTLDNGNGFQSLEQILIERRARLGKQDWFWSMALDISSAYVEELRKFEVCRTILNKAMEESDGTEPDVWEICKHEERLKESLHTLCKLMAMWFSEIMDPDQLVKHPLRSNGSGNPGQNPRQPK